MNLINRLIKRRFQIQKIFLRIRGAEIGIGNTFNGWLAVAGDPQNLVIGNHNVFNEYVVINCSESIRIGNSNHFSVGSKLISTKLNSNFSSHQSFPIIIGNNNWFAVDSVVAVRSAPIYFGDNIVIGAKSLVFSSIFTSGKYYGIIK